MLKRSHVRHFIALVEAGTFTEAARRLRITQPTLSVGIADLERLTGAKLFERGRRAVRLTERGGAFLAIARDLENRFRAADLFGHEKNPSLPSVRVGAIRTVPDGMLRSLIEIVSGSFEVELTEGSDSDLRAALKSHRLDMAVTVLRPIETGHQWWSALEEPYIVMAAADHRLAGRSNVPPAELAGETMIARRACEALTETSRFFTRHGVRPRFAFKSDNDSRCLAMAAAGLGITTAPASLAIPGLLPVGVLGYDLTRRVGALINPEFEAGDALLSLLAAHREDWAIGSLEPQRP